MLCDFIQGGRCYVGNNFRSVDRRSEGIVGIAKSLILKRRTDKLRLVFCFCGSCHGHRCLCRHFYGGRDFRLPFGRLCRIGSARIPRQVKV